MMVYFRRHPFSIMALCNVVGDLCYLGFAFDAQGWVSLPKLGGALFTIAAHTVLLAYGDDQAQHVASERGMVSRAVLGLRILSCRLLKNLPQRTLLAIRAKPVGIGFTMLVANGVGLLVDALTTSFSIANLSQIALAFCIIIGCGAFALADYVKGQRMADLLLRIAPPVLTLATAASAGLALTTHNGFVITALVVFLISSLTAFYTKIHKGETIG